MTEREIERKLVAVLYADVVGYSRLMGEDEAGTHKTVSAFLDSFAAAIEGHKGTVVHYAGDAVLAEFQSVIAAVTCAVDIQRDIAAQNAGISQERQVLFRIGVNLGEVIVARDEIYGDGVNIAARLESLADPGGICVSASVHQQVKGKIDVTFEDMGDQRVKNIAEPVRTYRVVVKQDEVVATTTGTSAPLPLSDKPSIAVLPFTNMSGDPEQEYFSDGITEDLTTELSKFHSLFVIAKNSATAFRGRSLSTKDIAERLGVRYVIEGSVRHVRKRVRIVVQLIDTQSETHLWAERYDRDLNDIFAVQDEITEAVVIAIEPRLAGIERQRARRKPPENLDAWESYQRGFWHLFRAGQDENETAQVFFAKAIDLQPDFALPHAALAYALCNEVGMARVAKPGDRLRPALESVQRAIMLDPYNAFGHSVLGRVHMMRREYSEAIASAKTAVEQNANLAFGHFGLGLVYLVGGQPTDAIPNFERALRLSPHDPFVWTYHCYRSAALLFIGRNEDALTAAIQATRHPHGEVWAHIMEPIVLAHLGRIDQAKAALMKVRSREPNLAHAYIHGYPWREPAHVTLLLEGLTKAGLQS